MTSQNWGAHLRRPWSTFCSLRRRRQSPHAPDLTRSGIFWGAESASSRHPIAKIVRFTATKMVRFLSVSIWGWLIPLMMVIAMEKPVVGQQVRICTFENGYKLEQSSNVWAILIPKMLTTFLYIQYGNSVCASKRLI